jgi:hypothetical protein
MEFALYYDVWKGEEMRKIAVFVFFLVFLSVFVFSYQEDVYYANSFARLNYVNGDVYIQRAEDQGYEEGTVNLPVVQGDKLGTREGRAEIHFGNKNYLRIDDFTQIDFVSLPQRDGDAVSLHLLSGNIYLRINFLEWERGFEVHSPDGSFYVLEEGLYRFEVRDNRETVAYAAEGSFEAAGKEGSELIHSGESLIAADGYFTSGPNYSYASYEDSFAEWNRGRDLFHNRYVSSSYLPEELNEYEGELAYYGQWVYERPYGYVWVPDVYHYTWRPYYNGRWVWYPICGWTWVSYEPWGWCVSHYGRWHWRGGLGWYWIPTRYWSPAWVYWYSGYDYIGWCPLSYYNRPVVIINNTFYGRYSDRYYPAHSRALTVIHKDQLSARHISRAALSGSSLTRLNKISLSSAQPKIRPQANRQNPESSSAAKALSRTNLRKVSKSYTSGQSIRSPSGLSRVGPTRTSQSSIGSGKTSRDERSPGTARRSQFSGSLTSRSGIRVYPSRSESSQKNSGVYSSQSRISSASRSNQVTRSFSRSTPEPQNIKRYPSQEVSPIKRRASASGQERKLSSTSSARSYSPFTRYPSSSAYSTRSRLSSSYRSPSSSSSRILSHQPNSTSRSSYGRTYSTPPSRSYSRIQSSSSSRNSYSPRSVSPSRGSSSIRSFKSPSRATVSRSSPTRSSASRSTSRSGSKSRVRKK